MANTTEWSVESSKLTTWRQDTLDWMWVLRAVEKQFLITHIFTSKGSFQGPTGRRGEDTLCSSRTFSEAPSSRERHGGGGVVQSLIHVWLCNPMDCSTPGLPVPHHLLEFAQVHVHCISDAIQPSYALTPSSPSALNLSQHQGLFQRIVCLHQMTKILALQYQSFRWIFRVDLP